MSSGDTSSMWSMTATSSREATREMLLVSNGYFGEHKGLLGVSKGHYGNTKGIGGGMKRSKEKWKPRKLHM